MQKYLERGGKQEGKKKKKKKKKSHKGGGIHSKAPKGGYRIKFKEKKSIIISRGQLQSSNFDSRTSTGQTPYCDRHPQKKTEQTKKNPKVRLGQRNSFPPKSGGEKRKYGQTGRFATVKHLPLIKKKVDPTETTDVWKGGGGGNS